MTSAMATFSKIDDEFILKKINLSRYFCNQFIDLDKLICLAEPPSYDGTS